MTWRFYRRVSLIPGLRVNLSRSGASFSIGHRGAWWTVGPRGRHISLGVPGTGIWWTENIPPHRPVHHGHRLALALLIVAAIVALIVIGKLVGPWL